MNKRLLQFSLREIMIAMVAISAVVALIVNNRPFRVSPFHASVDVDQLLSASARSLGSELRAGEETAGASASPDGRHEDHQIVFHSPSVKQRGKFMAELMLVVESSLSENGCIIHGRARSGDFDSNNLNEFRITYRCGKTRGSFYAYSHPAGDHSWRLLVIRHEW